MFNGCYLFLERQHVASLYNVRMIKVRSHECSDSKVQLRLVGTEAMRIREVPPPESERRTVSCHRCYSYHKLQVSIHMLLSITFVWGSNHQITTSRMTFDMIIVNLIKAHSQYDNESLPNAGSTILVPFTSSLEPDVHISVNGRASILPGS